MVTRLSRHDVRKYSRAGRLEGKVALISGSASGIGAAIAATVVEENGRVIIADVDVEKGTGVAIRYGSAAIFVRLDVGDAASWKAAVEVALSSFGRLDILINNACAPTGVSRIDQEAVEDHERQLRVNLTGAWHGIRANSLHPGVIETPGVAALPEQAQAGLRQSISRQAIKRLGRPEEAARVALFLASDEASYCAGTAVLVDGGHLAGRYRNLPDG